MPAPHPTPDDLGDLIPTPASPVRHFALDNGLKVYLQEDHRAPLACVQLWYHIGSSHDLAGHTNLSHVLEHMLFEGSAKLAPGQYSRIISHLGGSSNASTLNEATTYEVLAPASRLEVVLEIMADTMTNAHLDQQAFLKATEAVVNERRLKIDNNPLMKASEHHLRLAYGASTYATPAYGDSLDLEYMKLETLRTWYRTWYHPNNATLVVVGDVELPRLQTWVERHFASKDPALIATAAPPAPLAPSRERREDVSMPGLSDGLMMSFNVPGLVTAPNARTVPALQLVLSLLSEGPNATLYADLVRSRQVLSGIVGSYLPQLRGDTLFSLYAYSNPSNASAHDASARVWEAIDSFKQQPLSEKAVTQAKRSLLLQHAQQRDDLFQRARALGYQAALGLPIEQLDEALHTLIALSPEDIQDTAKAFLTQDRLTTTHLLAPTRQPDTSASTETPKALTCADLISALPEVDLSTLEASRRLDGRGFDALTRDILTWPTSQGSAVCFACRPGSSRYQLTLRFQAGACREDNAAGVAAATLYMLDQGADGQDAKAIAERLAELGATLHREITLEHASLTLSGRGSDAAREQAIGLLTALVARPDFEPSALLGIKSRLLAHVRRRDAAPADQARQRLHQQLFGEHPYSRWVAGSSADIEQIERAALQAFHARCYAAPNLDITFIGNLSQADAATCCERLAAALPQQPAPLPPLTAPAALAETQDTNILQASSNSHALLAVPLDITPQDADHLALEVAKEILGAGLESRLMRELRDRRALTYHIDAQLRHYRAGGWLEVTWDVEPAYRDAALALVRLTLKCFVEQGPSQGELTLAVNRMSGKLLRDFSSDPTLAARIAAINAHGLPAEHYHDRLQRLARLTPAEVRAALTRRMGLAHHLFISVGPQTEQRALPPVEARAR